MVLLVLLLSINLSFCNVLLVIKALYDIRVSTGSYVSTEEQHLSLVYRVGDVIQLCVVEPLTVTARRGGGIK